MKKVYHSFSSIALFLITLVVIYLVQNAEAENSIYHNSENHFSFKIPDGWMEVPQNVLDESIGALEYQANRANMSLPDIQRPVVIFQLKNQHWPSVPFPYFQVGISREGKAPKDEFKKFMTSEETAGLIINKGASDALKRIPPNMISNMKINKPVFDDKRNLWNCAVSIYSILAVGYQACGS
ncbi:MAG: hypothetical protein JRJ38_20175 [Deltaproteobacteria bacterium]|nr:hypothetical protein [Deltaproteobacteria bacterium]